MPTDEYINRKTSTSSTSLKSIFHTSSVNIVHSPNNYKALQTYLNTKPNNKTFNLP